MDFIGVGVRTEIRDIVGPGWGEVMDISGHDTQLQVGRRIALDQTVDSVARVYEDMDCMHTIIDGYALTPLLLLVRNYPYILERGRGRGGGGAYEYASSLFPFPCPLF